MHAKQLLLSVASLLAGVSLEVSGFENRGLAIALFVVAALLGLWAVWTPFMEWCRRLRWALARMGDYPGQEGAAAADSTPAAATAQGGPPETGFVLEIVEPWSKDRVARVKLTNTGADTSTFQIEMRSDSRGGTVQFANGETSATLFSGASAELHVTFEFAPAGTRGRSVLVQIYSDNNPPKTCPVFIRKGLLVGLCEFRLAEGEWPQTNDFHADQFRNAQSLLARIHGLTTVTEAEPPDFRRQFVETIGSLRDSPVLSDEFVDRMPVPDTDQPQQRFLGQMETVLRWWMADLQEAIETAEAP